MWRGEKEEEIHVIVHSFAVSKMPADTQVVHNTESLLTYSMQYSVSSKFIPCCT
jgi:hypothetical protein